MRCWATCRPGTSPTSIPARPGTDLDADLKRAAADAESFAKDYEGKVAGLDGKALGGAVARFEALNDLMGRIGSYAQLYYAQDMADPERGQFLAEHFREADRRRRRAGVLPAGAEQARGRRSRRQAEGPGARQIRRPGCATCGCYRPHQLSDELEKCAARPVGRRQQPPGRACSTRRSPGCAIPFATRC